MHDSDLNLIRSNLDSVYGKYTILYPFKEDIFTNHFKTEENNYQYKKFLKEIDENIRKVDDLFEKILCDREKNKDNDITDEEKINAELIMSDIVELRNKLVEYFEFVIG